jgi:adenosylcobinamide-phosphate synthase
MGWPSLRPFFAGGGPSPLKRQTLLISAYLVDAVAGDPEWFPHPVRVIGAAAICGEALLRKPRQSAAAEVTLGATLTTAIVAAAYGASALVLRQSRRRSSLLANSIELLLGWTCLAARDLDREATSVVHALALGDLPDARTRLARIVGRDTGHLDAQEISRAVIETVAESASDGVSAPLFYITLGGVPLALAYKAVNTLDSMIGHADSRYFYFGKFAARLDDAANFLPARLTALGLVASSYLIDGCNGLRAFESWQRDGAKHKSPNAGQPEAAMAGALGVCLGGENSYAGEIVASPLLGAGFPPPSPQDAAKAIRLMTAASILALAAGVLFAVFTPDRGRR